MTQVLAVVANLALVSCNGTSPPSASGLTGSYEVILVGDKPLPAVIATVGFISRQERVVSGELVFCALPTSKLTTTFVSQPESWSRPFRIR